MRSDRIPVRGYALLGACAPPQDCDILTLVAVVTQLVLQATGGARKTGLVEP